MKYADNGDLKVHNSHIQKAIDEFLVKGVSGPHSSNGTLLAPILNYCVKQNVPFQLTFNGNYHLSRIAVE